LELKDDAASGINQLLLSMSDPAGSEPTIRKALAIGADDAIRVNAESPDAWFVASQIAEVVKKEKFDLIMCGIESSDYNGSSVGGMVSEFLGIPSVSAVSGISIENGQPVMTREIDGGKEIVSAPVPLVAIVQKGIAKEPRIAAMRGIMMARSKPVKLIEPVATEPLTQISVFEKPSPRAACKYIDADNPELLISLLQNEAKVI
jgi:electron transfer flavoprotein beta subunit